MKKDLKKHTKKYIHIAYGDIGRFLCVLLSIGLSVVKIPYRKTYWGCGYDKK